MLYSRPLGLTLRVWRWRNHEYSSYMHVATSTATKTTSQTKASQPTIRGSYLSMMAAWGSTAAGPKWIAVKKMAPDPDRIAQ
jgi:hypothetical protein